MKKATSVIMVLFALSVSFAQTPLILDETTVPAVPDSVTYSRVAIAGVQPAAKGAAQTWDFSALHDSLAPSGYKLEAAASPNFPNADLFLLSYESIPAGSAIAYDLMYEIDSSSNRLMGYDIHEQRYGLQGIVPFAQATDSFIVPEQHVVYGSPQMVHDFPATEGGSWSSNIVRTYSGYLTFAALSFNNVLVTKVVHEARHDTVAGWGKLRVPHYGSGASSIDYDVLMIQRARTVKDSFYLNGAPADSATLAAFQLQQGKVTPLNRTFFYRAYFHQPLMYYVSTDTTFSDIISLLYDIETTPLNTGLESENNIRIDAAIIPNPIHERSFNLVITAENKEQLKVRIFDLAGRLLSETGCTAPSGTSSHLINIEAEKGVYLVNIINEKGKSLYRKVVVD